MEINFETDFKKAASDCKHCYEINKELSGKRDTNFKVFANQSLLNIINSCVEGNKEFEMAKTLQRVCSGCEYRDSRIRNDLEVYGIKII